MPINADFSFVRLEDFVLSFSLVNPTDISTWAVQFRASKHFGSCSGLIIKSEAPGFQAGQSGITVTNAATGQFNVAINSVDTSGFDPGNFAYEIERLDAGFRTVLSDGYLILLPSLEC